jgi:hypothetical protein
MGWAVARIRAALGRRARHTRLRVSIPGARRAGVVDAAAADVWRTCGLDLEPPSLRDPAMSEPASRRRAREIVAVHHLLAGRRPEAWAAAGGGA